MHFVMLQCVFLVRCGKSTNRIPSMKGVFYFFEHLFVLCYPVDVHACAHAWVFVSQNLLILHVYLCWCMYLGTYVGLCGMHV